MDAWGTLLAGSSLPSGDAWEHLGAQGGVSKTIFVSEFTIDLVDSFAVDLFEEKYTVELVQAAFDVQMDCGPKVGLTGPINGVIIDE